MKILLYPDIFYTGHSGAIAAREAARIFTKMGHEVAIFTFDKPSGNFGYKNYERPFYKASANYLSKEYSETFNYVISDFKPDLVFFIGLLVGVPIVYFDICFQKKIKTAILILIQDFFCARLYTAVNNLPCTKCLTGSNLNSLVNGCLREKNWYLLRFANYQISQIRYLKRLKKIDYVFGSTKEQLEFYQSVGVSDQNIFHLPLFFDRRKIAQNQNMNQMGDYFVIIAQNRVEKGIGLIEEICAHLEINIRIKMLFYDEIEAMSFIDSYPKNLEFVKNGQLEILPGVTMTSGALEIISGSRGVINPSIWATTTEFVFLEILGMAKPIIAFNVGIHKEVIINRENGILVDIGDFSGLSKELSNLLHDDELYRNISCNSLRLFDKLTEDSVFIDKLTAVFQSVVIDLPPKNSLPRVT